MKRMFIGMLVQVISGFIFWRIGMPDLFVGTVSCSLNWFVCYYDAQPNFNLFSKNETDI